VKWRYLRDQRRLCVTNPELDLTTVRTLIRRGVIPGDLDAIIFRTDNATAIVRGHHLRRVIDQDGPEASP
jgi:hypothetical protein